MRSGAACCSAARTQVAQLAVVTRPAPEPGLPASHQAFQVRAVFEKDQQRDTERWPCDVVPRRVARRVEEVKH